MKGMPIKSNIGLSESSILMYTGYTREIYLLEYDSEERWTTDNEEIAVVSDGVIKAVSPGNTVIHCVTKDGKDFSCEVEVRKCVSDAYRIIAEEEAQWIESLQLSDGSFSCYELDDSLPVRVNPYFSCYAALAMLQSDYENSKKENINAYLNWYFAHMNMEKDINGSVGTIYDYQVNVQGKEVISETNMKSYDSADSYSAMFLILLWKYFDKYQDSEIMSAQKGKIDQLVDILLSLQSGGYTESIQGSDVKYLMNNVEVYQGMQCALRLYKSLWKTEERTIRLDKAVTEFQDNFDCIWWEKDHYYSVLERNNQSFYGDTMDWGKLYEFAVPQLFPVMFGVKKAEEEQSQKVYSYFCRQWKWESMEYDNQTDGNQTWSMIAYAAAIMRDYKRVDEFLGNIKNRGNDRGYPYYSGDSVWVILTCEEAFRYYSNLERRGLEIEKN